MPILDASLGCSKCGADLPEGAQFCVRCGKPVSSSPKRPIASPAPVDVPLRKAADSRRRRRLVLVCILVLFLGAVVWAMTSESQTALDIQEIVGWKHDQTIVDTQVSVSAHSFRYYKFSLPQGSLNVAMIGDFSVAGDSPNAGGISNKNSGKGRDVDKDSSNIELYVLSEPAFTVWQNGYATSSLYESGRVGAGTIKEELPAGAGIYFLVFSNRFSPKTPKSVHASVLLRYKSWLPESLRRMGDRFWNWMAI
jgi:hypothetical protein